MRMTSPRHREGEMHKYLFERFRRKARFDSNPTLSEGNRREKSERKQQNRFLCASSWQNIERHELVLQGLTTEIV